MSDSPDAPHDRQPLLTGGAPLAAARGALILVHGRGATASGILSLGQQLQATHLAWFAPQAGGNTWYPQSFLAPTLANEPGLSSAVRVLGTLVARLEGAGVPAERIAFAGFSQGACLTLEFVARHARRYAGVLAFSGGLVGPDGTPRDYPGDFAGTPVFLGCSDVDGHVPLPRVRESERVLRAMGAAVDCRIYPGMGHLVNDDEVQAGRDVLAAVGGAVPGSAPTSR